MVKKYTAMPKLGFLLLITGLFLYACESTGSIEEEAASEVLPVKKDFGADWEFRRLGPQETGLWETVKLPHTTRIEPLVVNDQWQGEAQYEKRFEVGFPGSQQWFLYFEGVMQEAKVFLNDSLAAHHHGGYLPFQVHLNPYLLEGQENVLRVEVSNVDDPSIPPGKPLEEVDFNYYGGIYRNLYLIKKGPLYITDPIAAKEVNSGGVLVHFDQITDSLASGLVKTHLHNASQTAQNLHLRYSFTDSEGNTQRFRSREQHLSAGEQLSISKRISLTQARLWSPDDPQLYQVTVSVFAQGSQVDQQVIQTGIRSIELSGEAFYLNGEKLFLNGTNRHQEYPYLGYALSDEAQYRDAYKIKQAGFNFVRMSHYPQAESFLEACDELGLLVMNAIPGWQHFKEGAFEQNALQDIRDMARRDRHHPSVVFWENSLNESGMTEAFMIRANEVLKSELPYSDTFSAGWIDHPSYDLYIPARQHAQPPAYWNDYNRPERPLLIAEYGDWEYYAQNAGFNQQAFEDLKEEERTSRQFRGAGEKALLQQALNFQEAFNSNLKGKQTIGHANWLMFDYNRGYSNDLETSGIADIFRVPKFAYYFYKSQKSPVMGSLTFKEKGSADGEVITSSGDVFTRPMIFIASHWRPSSSTNIRVFTNTQEVALYLNGELLERKSAQRDAFSDALPYPPFHFEVGEFRRGTLRAVGFMDGNQVVAHQVSSPGEPAGLKLEVDLSNKPIARDHPDMVFLYVHILDENGNPVPDCQYEVMFSIEGEPETAKLLGGESVMAEGGIASSLLKTSEFKEPLVIKASSRGLGEARIKISTQ